MGLVEPGCYTQFNEKLFNMDWNMQQAAGQTGVHTGEVCQVNAGGTSVHPKDSPEG